MSLRTLSSMVAGLLVLSTAGTASAQIWNPLTWLEPPAPRCYGPYCPPAGYDNRPMMNRGYGTNYAPAYGPVGYGPSGYGPVGSGGVCRNGQCGLNAGCPNGVCNVPGSCRNGQCGVNGLTNYGPRDNAPLNYGPRYDVQPGYYVPRNVAPAPYVPQPWNAAPLSRQNGFYDDEPQMTRTPRRVEPARFEEDEWTVSRAPRTRPVYNSNSSPFYP